MKYNICIHCGRGKKLSAARGCRPCANKRRIKLRIGKKNSASTRLKISEALTGNKLSPEHKLKLSKIATGIKNGINTRFKAGKAHYNYKDGTGHLPYSCEYKKARDIVLKRDHYRCQNSACVTSSTRVSVHHIDGDKNNNSIGNLVTLCYHCHLSLCHRQGIDVL